MFNMSCRLLCFCVLRWVSIVDHMKQVFFHLGKVGGCYRASRQSRFSTWLLYFVFLLVLWWLQKGGPGASGRVLPPMTGRSWVQVAVCLHCTGEGKACHWHPSPDLSSLHWVRPIMMTSQFTSSTILHAECSWNDLSSGVKTKVPC